LPGWRTEFNKTTFKKYLLHPASDVDIVLQISNNTQTKSHYCHCRHMRRQSNDTVFMLNSTV